LHGEEGDRKRTRGKRRSENARGNNKNTRGRDPLGVLEVGGGRKTREKYDVPAPGRRILGRLKGKKGGKR